MKPMKRFPAGYQTLCDECRSDFSNSPQSPDMHIAKHGGPDSNECANCEKLCHANQLSTCRIWYC